MDDFNDNYDGGDDFTDEVPEEEYPDEEPVEPEMEDAHSDECNGIDLDDFILGAGFGYEEGLSERRKSSKPKDKS
jgi:hypothetical protein